MENVNRLSSMYKGAYKIRRKPDLKLTLEPSTSGDAMVIRCAGRIVYREEAASLSRAVKDALWHANQVVLDLEDVKTIDSAGLGELVLVHMIADNRRKTVTLLNANAHVRELLDLTNLSSVFQMSSAIEYVEHREAVAAGD